MLIIIMRIKLVTAKYLASLNGFTPGVLFLKRFGDILSFRNIDHIHITFMIRKENRGKKTEKPNREDAKTAKKNNNCFIKNKIFRVLCVLAVQSFSC